MKPQTAFPCAVALASIPSATKPPALKGMRFWSLLLLGTLAVGLAGVNEARAAFAVGTTVCTAQSKTAGTTLACTVATQAISAGEVAVLWFAGDNTATADGNDGLLSSVADSGGNAWTVQRCYTNAQGAAAAGATTCVATSKITTTIPIAGTITATFASITAKSIVVKNFTVAAGNTIAVTGTPQDTFNDSTSTAPGSLTISGLAASTEYLFVRSTALERANTTWTVTASHTIATCNGTTGGAAATNMNICGEFRILTATSDTSNPTATSVDSASTFIAFKEVASTTLGNGTDPGGASLAPGGTVTMADAFTFQTSTGTDTITAVVVGLATGTSVGLGLVEITNDAGTTVYGSVTDPASDTPSITLSTGTLTATTTSIQYKIRITPKSHAAMPAPAGATYTVTAKINSWTGTNTAAGSDTAGTTITIDNLSPGNVTAASGTSGDTQVVLTWTNPVDADFNSTVVLRSTTGAVTDTPAEGTTYMVGNTIGASTVACVVASPTATCTDTSVTNGTTYDYKIFTRDTNVNYSATGVVPTGSPFIPSAPGCYAKATGNWESASTWAANASGTGTCPGAGGVPDAGTPAYINVTTAYTVTVTTATAAAASVLIGAPNSGTSTLAIGTGTLTVGGSVTVTGGTGTKKASLTFTTGTLKLGGNLTDSGGTVLTWGTGTVEYNGTGAQTVGAYGYYNLTINKTSGTATTGANITIGNNLTLTTGTLNIGANTIDRGTAGGVLTLSAGSTLQIAAANLPANYSTVSIATTSTVEYNPSFNMTVPAPGGGANYGNLLLSNSGNRAFNVAMTVAGNLTTTGTVAVAMNAGITVNGNFDLGSGTSFDAKAYSHIVRGNFTNNGTFTTNTGANTFTFDGSSAQTITGGVTSFNTVVFNNAAGVTTSVNLSITGNFTNTAGFNAGTTTTTFTGTAAQTISGPATTAFNNLTVNKSSGGVTLSLDVTVNGLLTLTGGNITTGTTTAPNPYPYTLITTTSCTTPSVSRPGGSPGRIVGNLRKKIPTGSSIACTFEVGDSTKYTPIDVTFASVSGTEGSVTGATMPWSTDGHPAVASIDIDPNLNVNRFWTLKNNTVTFTSYEATFNFCSSTVTIDCPSTDIDTGASTADFVIRRYSPEYANSGTWSNVTLATDGAQPTYTKGSGITGLGDFAVGQSTIRAFSREREWIYQRELYY